MVKRDRIYLSPPHIGGREQELIAEAFATNWIAPLGPHVDAFEKEIAEYIGIAGGAATSSGTAAIHLALRLLGIGRGDTVFCSSFTFIASTNPVLYQRGTPIFIDSEPASWNMSPQALERAMADAAKAGKLPKAVVIVNLYGQSADMAHLMDICNHYGVPVIEDAAESLGATYRGRASGTFGKFGIFSFNGNKIITTAGGGMLVSEDLDALAKARFWATQARDRARHYQHSEMGYNYRLSNILAGIGRGQLELLDSRIEARRRIFDHYQEALGSIDGIDFMPECDYGLHTRWLTTLTIDPDKCGISAEEVVDRLAEYNIETRPVWKPLHMQPLFKDCIYYPHELNYSVCEDIFAKGLCLPSGSALTGEEQQFIIGLIKGMLK